MNTPDTTKAQIAALTQAILAVLIAFGVHLTQPQQLALLGLSGVVFTTLVVADAIIRHGRSRALAPSQTVADPQPAAKTSDPTTRPTETAPASPTTVLPNGTFPATGTSGQLPATS